MQGANLGTLLRTCDAVGACLAVPRLLWVASWLTRRSGWLIFLRPRSALSPCWATSADRNPAEALELLDVAVEIPMIGAGASLNVAVAGSLVLYRLAGFL